ncbi:hypothetical protein [Maridesulfovibrio frigidus]|uniref:hypothetical protein n=1 Tax=Maridesulfovibrio frigidus TaxID=340956 RepID=UPI0004E126DC|nr:hypothetical protein [Maridesulfovibrio frigidus]
MQKEMKTFTIAAGTLGNATLLQRGVRIHGTAGMSIREFIEIGLGLAPEYVEKQIRTIFLNNSPADDIDIVQIKDGDILSLSGALPGVAGMAMGRDTAISGFRSEIRAVNSGDVGEGDAFVSVKLFNLIARDSGPKLLERGVIVKASEILKSYGENAPEGLAAEDGTVILKTIVT